ncbi:hypothetical protein RJ640_005391 [Escallonia rubra]|uniref:Uncharacterized protein n=1 Tax=Escallonia rubra TaxID=112253 RepID=A0AA88UGX6_9ASTE|nr:hypothetical protein RJ640_005391 [Escallonia rubra]
MEDPVKDQSAASANTNKSAAKLLRYPLRSATKPKEEKAPVDGPANSSAAKRGRPAPSVSKSVGVLDLSGKDKSAKPPRRLSIPAKSTASPAPKVVGIVTPISEARAKRTVCSQGKGDTPVSDVSRSSNRRKFSVLSSASYWLSQIKLSETAAKHSISLGFFKLALEAGCEPLQRVKDELKSYSCRHNLVELGEPVSETCSHMPEEGTRSSDEDINSSSSITETRKLKPKSLNTDQGSPVKESVNRTKQKSDRVSTIRVAANKNDAPAPSEARDRKARKTSQKSNKQECKKEKDKVKKHGKKPAHEEGLVSPSTVEEVPEGNKENVFQEELMLQSRSVKTKVLRPIPTQDTLQSQKNFIRHAGPMPRLAARMQSERNLTSAKAY